MQIEYLTSFSNDLYEGSGQHLLASFQEQRTIERMLVYHEGLSAHEQERWDSAAFEFIDLRKDKFLQNWLQANQDIIPAYLGGKARECRCPGRERRHAKHKARCHFSWMNRNASRFFRKVAAWRHATLTTAARYLVWCDSDCVVERMIPEDKLREWLQESAVLYFQGKREAAETGIVVLDLQVGAGVLVGALCGCYASKAFRQYERWDDGFVFTKLLLHRLVGVRDLVNPLKQVDNHVIPTTEMWKYVQHRKGLHGRVSGIMK